MNKQQLRPTLQSPSLSFSLTDGTMWRLSDQFPETFTMIVFYRGLHCPVCKSYSKKLNNLAEQYYQKGVEIVTVSMDSKDRALQSKEEWGLDNIDVGYGLSEQAARSWGLFLSEGIKDEEPELFSEPGLFLVKPNGVLYYQGVNSMPFGRPDLEAMLGAIDFVTKQDYPARGEVR